MELTVDKVVEQYIKLRNQKGAIEAEVKEKVAGINDKLTKIEMWIQQKADAQGVTSFKTPHGTAFIASTDFASVADWDAVLEFVREGNHYDLLTKGVSKAAVRGYIDETKQVPPGVNFGSRLSVNVRKPTKKAD